MYLEQGTVFTLSSGIKVRLKVTIQENDPKYYDQSFIAYLFADVAEVLDRFADSENLELEW